MHKQCAYEFRAKQEAKHKCLALRHYECSAIAAYHEGWTVHHHVHSLTFFVVNLTSYINKYNKNVCTKRRHNLKLNSCMLTLSMKAHYRQILFRKKCKLSDLAVNYVTPVFHKQKGQTILAYKNDYLNFVVQLLDTESLFQKALFKQYIT